MKGLIKPTSKPKIFQQTTDKMTVTPPILIRRGIKTTVIDFKTASLAQFSVAF